MDSLLGVPALSPVTYLRDLAYVRHILSEELVFLIGWLSAGWSYKKNKSPNHRS